MSCKNAMEDSRAFTDYTSNCSMNEYLKRKFGVEMNSTNYRLFLQRYGQGVMDDLRKRSEWANATGCNCFYAHPPHDEYVAAAPYDPNDTEYILKYHEGEQSLNALGCFPSHRQGVWM